MQNTILIIRECLLGALDATGNALYDEREIRSITDLLIEEVCGLTRVDRVLHPEQQLPISQRERLEDIAHQLQAGKPVQQALGYAWFHGARFRVSPYVLVPRPETAELVDWVVSAVPHPPLSAPLRICDIGTGTGCIALSLARLIPQSSVLAVDVSEAALQVASANAADLQITNVEFDQQDILCATPDVFGSVDVIVSNPPYICRHEASQMSDLVLCNEPELALFVPDEDPLLFYRSIAYLAKEVLTPGGQLFFEINAAYGPETCQMLRIAGFGQVELRQDINGRDRMVRAIR